MRLGIFPSSAVFLDLFLKWFVVLLVEVIFTSFVKFIPRYFIFGGRAIVNGMFSYILSQFVHYWYIERLPIFVS
jgi:hypothetical protein